MKSFNEISAPQQQTHLFKYHTIFNTTEFLDVRHHFYIGSLCLLIFFSSLFYFLNIKLSV